jgi:hypothetical protein
MWPTLFPHFIGIEPLQPHPASLPPTHPHAPDTLWEAVRQIVQLVRSLAIFDISSSSRFVSDKCQMKQYWMVY